MMNNTNNQQQYLQLEDTSEVKIQDCSAKRNFKLSEEQISKQKHLKKKPNEEASPCKKNDGPGAKILSYMKKQDHRFKCSEFDLKAGTMSFLDEFISDFYSGKAKASVHLELLKKYSSEDELNQIIKNLTEYKDEQGQIVLRLQMFLYEANRAVTINSNKTERQNTERENPVKVRFNRPFENLERLNSSEDSSDKVDQEVKVFGNKLIRISKTNNNSNVSQTLNNRFDSGYNQGRSKSPGNNCINRTFEQLPSCAGNKQYPKLANIHHKERNDIDAIDIIERKNQNLNKSSSGLINLSRDRANYMTGMSPAWNIVDAKNSKSEYFSYQTKTINPNQTIGMTAGANLTASMNLGANLTASMNLGMNSSMNVGTNTSMNDNVGVKTNLAYKKNIFSIKDVDRDIMNMKDSSKSNRQQKKKLNFFKTARKANEEDHGGGTLFRYLPKSKNKVEKFGLSCRTPSLPDLND